MEDGDANVEQYISADATLDGVDSVADTVGEPGPRVSKTDKKRQRYEEKIAHQKLQRKRIKTERKASKHSESMVSEPVTDAIEPKPREDTNPERLTKKQRLREVKARLQEARLTGQRVCIDLSLEHHMSQKELSRLAQQLCRLYGSNRAAHQPVHIFFSGLNKTGDLYRECVRKNDGFDNYIVDMSEENHTEIFQPQEIVYLSPDSQNALTSVSRDKVYIIGGLVDENITRNISLSSAESAKIETARLPIDEYMDKTNRAHSKVLSVNQVFDILLTFIETGEWGKALLAGVPPRKGYRLKQQFS